MRPGPGILGILCLLASTCLLAQSATSIPPRLSQVENCRLAALRAQAEAPGWNDQQVCAAALELSLLPRERISVLVNRGLILVQLGDFDQAMASYDAALALSSNYASIYLNRGNLLYLLGDYQAALRDYNEALPLANSETELVYVNRAMALQALGRLDDAERDYRAALEMLPGWPLVADKLQRLEALRQPGSAEAG